MADSLRDQLLKSGLASKTPETRRPRPAQRGARPGRNNPPVRAASATQAHGGSKDAEIDLAQAYALRAKTEAGERRRAEQAAAEQARLKRERKVRVRNLLQDAWLNTPDADAVRHFEYGGKIRRIYLDPAQLVALNAGELGVVQHDGRFALVRRDIAARIAEIEPRLLAVLVDPDAAEPVGGDGVPDDLVW